ncbi:hypothetical protein PIB30_071432 [Stylosanthes scabra]|uniref:Uncharacterized protein n=1 Tax=Stylosanthes scabra TaxID=79078 RepID=A0ABU6TNF7_9FABA|nr:hypothetical protein [Stylosanthes scabra]
MEADLYPAKLTTTRTALERRWTRTNDDGGGTTAVMVGEGSLLPCEGDGGKPGRRGQGRWPLNQRRLNPSTMAESRERRDATTNKKSKRQGRSGEEGEPLAATEMRRRRWVWVLPTYKALLRKPDGSPFVPTVWLFGKEGLELRKRTYAQATIAFTRDGKYREDCRQGKLSMFSAIVSMLV